MRFLIWLALVGGMAALGCGGSQTRETLCDVTHGTCGGCVAALETWCNPDAIQDERTEALCEATAVACRVCIAAEEEYCE